MPAAISASASPDDARRRCKARKGVTKDTGACDASNIDCVEQNRVGVVFVDVRGGNR